MAQGKRLIQLSVSKAAYNKQINGDIGRGWKAVEWSIDEITNHLMQGFPISVARLSGDHRLIENFVSSQIIGIDFDTGPDPDTLVQEDEWIARYAFLVYMTPTSTPDKPRSRALFILDKPITDRSVYQRLVLKMLQKYGSLGADKQCKDPVRVFFGSDKRQYTLRDKTLEIARIMTLPDPAATRPAPTDDENFSFGGRELSDILAAGVQIGQRDNDALRLVGALSNHLSQDVVREIMRLWYNGKVEDKTGFEWTKIESMITRMADKTTHVRKQVQSVVETAQKAAAQIQASPYSTSFSDFTTQTDQDVEWIIEGWLPKATTGLIVAPPSSFKTWIMMAMALSVGTGLPFLGKYPVSGAAPVLIIQQEDSKQIIRQRLKTIYTAMVGELQIDEGEDTFSLNLIIPNVDIYTLDETLRFDNPASMAKLRDVIALRGYKLVMLDPLYSAADSEGYMAKDAQRMVEFKRLRDQFETSFMMLHHTKKQTEGVNRLDAWGSQFLNAWIETGFQIRRTSGQNTVILQRHFKISAVPATEVLTFDIDTDPENRKFNVTVEQEGERMVIPDDAANNASVDILQIMGDRTMRTAEIVRETGLAASTVSRRMQKLENQGRVTRDDSGAYRKTSDAAY